MNDLAELLVKPTATMFETMQIIDRSSQQFAVVVDEDTRLLGTVTDGDIRRGLLKGNDVNTPIEMMMNANPIYERVGKSIFEYHEILKHRKIRQLPIIDSMNRVVNIIFGDNERLNSDKNTVILMLGGKGSRLRPLTNDIPKPMLKVGNKPILETIIDGFKQYGYTNFIFSVNYKKDIIKDYFQNGHHFNVNIEYIEEDKPLGTAGALSLLTDRPSHPFFVMNGDLLTQINFDQLMEFHNKHNSVATMCVREYAHQIPYGVIETDGTTLIKINEKPISRSFVNAGIYVLSPEVLYSIPDNEYFDMPTLFEQLISKNKNTTVFPIHEYWLDIGQMDEYKRAESEYSKVFKRDKI